MSARRIEAPEDASLLDLCCGTGLSTEALCRAHPTAKIAGLDASAGMLEQAAEKSHLFKVAWIHGDAMDPAASGATGPYDGILMAYGFVGPLASALKNIMEADGRYYQCMKVGILAHVAGNAPAISIEFARKMLSSDVRPTFQELEEAVSDIPPLG